MTVSSAGEGNLRVDTDAPNPRNRRVEIRFQPELPFNLGLDLPSLGHPSLNSGIPSPDADPASASPEISLDVPSSYSLQWRPETPEEAGRRIFTPVPDLNLPRLSLRQAVFDRIDEDLNSVMDDLDIPEWAQGLIRDGAHAAVSRGAESLLNTALDQARVSGEAREALQTTFRALVQVEIPLR